MQALILEQQDGNTVASVQALDESRSARRRRHRRHRLVQSELQGCLAITGKGKIIRNFPMVPWIDFAGHVHSSEDPRFHAASRCCSPVGASAKITGAGWQRRRG